MQSLTLEIPYEPHPKQWLFHNSKARFRILSCGRRFGKTLCGANEAVKQATKNPNTVGFCVAPTYWHTTKQWTEFLRFCPPRLIVDINRSDHHITLINNIHVWFKSADNPNSLRSQGLDWLWVDEGGQIGEEAWTLALRPALVDKQGIAWFTGTPAGKNWYFALWTRGQDKQQSDYESWAFSSYENPTLNHNDNFKELDEFKRDMPELAYRQEILGEFLDDIGSVFRRIRDCVSGTLEEPQPNKRYVLGVDLAKHVDFTAITILDNNGHLVYFDRFSQIDWPFQEKRIVDASQRYNNARILVDSSGVGDPVYDNLRRVGVSVEGYKFTNASKKDLIENLSIAIENKSISYPDIPVLLSELGLYGYKISPAGVTTYGAPEGYHDDTVIALALACWQTNKPRGFWIK